MGATNEQMAADDDAIDAWVYAQYCGGETQGKIPAPMAYAVSASNGRSDD